MIFGERLRELDERNDGYRLHLQLTGEQGRMGPADLDELCPDWREREAFVSGPGEMLDALTEHWEAEADPERLHMERFQPKIGTVEEGEGGTIQFRASETETEADGGTPILVAGEEAGARAALRLPRGHLPHLRRQALRGAGARPAHRQGLTARRARWSAPASTPPRATSRSNYETREGNLMATAEADAPEAREPARAAHATSRSRSSAASSTRSTTRSTPTSATATAATSRA